MNDTRPPAELARHYRFRAEQLRNIAREWADSGHREVLHRVAKDYEQIADRIEKHLPPPESSQ
jgi:hypothetical protein